jgi:putative acetyltransferase
MEAVVTGAVFVVRGPRRFRANRAPMPDLFLRRALREESDAVAALFRLSRLTALPCLPDLHTPDEDRAFFRDRVFAECSVWVAPCEGSLAGFCAFRDGWVDHLYVAPEQYGQQELCLWTFQRNGNARRFYESHGFVVERLTAGENEEREPDVLYRWRRRDVVPTRD